MKQHLKLIVLPLVIAVAAGLSSTLFWYHQTHKETNLPNPAPAARYGEHDEGRMAVLALESLGKDRKRNLSAWVKSENQDRFIELLQNAQAGLGWHIHPQGKGLDGRAVQIILPWKDMQKLEDLADEPERWARNHTPGATAAEPEYDQMTHAVMWLKSSDYGTLTLIGGSIITIFTGIIGIVMAFIALEQRRSWGTPPPKDAPRPEPPPRKARAE